MLIEELELEGYNRLRLRDIQYFRMQVTSPYQIIVGTNGSGKTSIMRRMSPIPAPKAAFNKKKGGRHHIKIKHRGRSYELTSIFGKGSGNSFVCDNVELNEGRTSTTQVELIKQHFNLDNNLLKVMLGVSKFTRMDAIERREWIMRLSGSDMRYAMSLFNKLKVKVRDSIGALKHLTTRLNSEIKNLPQEGEIDQLKERAKQLEDKLTMLLQHKEPNARSRKDLLDDIGRVMNDIKTTSSKILNSKAPDGIRCKPTEIVRYIDEAKADVAGSASLLDAYSTDYNRICQIVDTMRQNGATGVQDIETSIELIKRDIETKKGQLSSGTLIPDQSLCSTIDTVHQQLVDIMSNIPDNRDRRHAAERQVDVQARMRVIRSQLDELKKKLGVTLHQLEHLDTDTKHQCPKCEHTFVPQLIQGQEVSLTANRNALQSSITNYENELETLEKWTEENTLYRAYLRDLNVLVKAWPSLRPLWDTIAEAWDNGATPKLAIPAIHRFKNDVVLSGQIIHLQEQLDTLQTTYKQVMHEQQSSATQLEERLSELQERMHETSELVTQHRINLRMLETFKTHADTIHREGVKLREHFQPLVVLMNNIETTYRNEALGIVIGEHQTQLAEVSTLLRNAISATDRIEDIRRSRNEVEADLEAYTILMNELSPTDGLIADQMKGFIQCFVEQMNTVISQIWTYPMEIIPCGMESDELNYKFPLCVNNSEDPADDVSEGSDSQVDVVDFAFKLVVMLYLELDDYPLFLDELAPSFDEQHRLNLVAFVKQLVETKRCSQLFMISHYASGHEAFVQAEFCVMDSTNIINRPLVFNKHVTMR